MFSLDAFIQQYSELIKKKESIRCRICDNSTKTMDDFFYDVTTAIFIAKASNYIEE